MLATDHDFDDAQSFFYQPKLLRGVYSILLVSFLMSIFEIVFFRFVVQVQTTAAVTDLTRSMQNNVGKILYASKPQMTPAQSSFIEYIKNHRDNPASAILTATRQREQYLIDKNNLYAYLIGTAAIFGVLFFMYLVHSRLERVLNRKHSLIIFGTEYGAAILTAFLTVGCLASFQYLFYLFGTQFKYMGSSGMDELEHFFNNSVRKNLGLQEIPP